MTEPVESANEPGRDLVDPCEADVSADPARARKKAMDYLARREYGRAELEARLEDAGFDKGTARTVVDGLAAEGLQSDRRLVEDFIRSRIAQGKGPVRIRLELKGRGLDEGLVDELLAACDADWQHLARRIREKKFGPEMPADFSEKARQMRFLQYRGFEPGQIQAAVAPRGDA